MKVCDHRQSIRSENRGRLGKPRSVHIGFSPAAWFASQSLSEPGYEDYLQAISVLKGQPVSPLSKVEVEALRVKYSHRAIYQ